MRLRLTWLGIALIVTALIGVDVSAQAGEAGAAAEEPSALRVRLRRDQRESRGHRALQGHAGRSGRDTVLGAVLPGRASEGHADVGSRHPARRDRRGPRARRAGESNRDVRGGDDGSAYAREPVGGSRVSSGGHHLLCVLARAHRSQRQREPVRRFDVAGAAGRARVHVGGRQYARQPHVLRQDQGLEVDQPRQGRVRRLRRRQRDPQSGAWPFARPSGDGAQSAEDAAAS